MRIRARFAHAMRSPRRLFWFGWRTAMLILEGELFAAWDRAHPHGISRKRYRSWCRRHSALGLASIEEIGRPSLRVVALVDCGSASVNARIAASLARQTLPCAAIFARDADRGPLLVRTDATPPRPPAESSDTLASCLAESDGNETWLLWITAPVTLDDEYNASLAATVAVAPEARIVYTDEDALDARGDRIDPEFKSAWDVEQILEANYPGPAVAMRAPTALDLIDDRLRGATGLWQALVKATWRTAGQRIVHLPAVLVHRWPEPPAADAVAREPDLVNAVQEAVARRGATVSVVESDSPRLRYAELPNHEGVSIVIPTRDRSDLLMRCIDSLVANTSSPRFEVVIVDNGSVDAETKCCFRAIERRAPTRVVSAPGTFNFSRLCNAGVAQARERIVVLLNNDTYVRDGGWLRELAALAQRPYTGAVGPLLLYEDGRVQAAGVLVAVNRVATNFLAGFRPDDPLVRAWCRRRHQVTAVSGACIAVEKSKYLVVGGMDERFAVSLNEVDFCLKLEQAGYANIFTPFATLVHTEGASRGFDFEPRDRQRLAVEERRFRANWGSLMSQYDPAHNPNLRRVGNPLEIEFRSARVEPRSGWRRALIRGPSTVISDTKVA